MTICCRIDDRQIHHRLRHMGASTLKVGLWPDSVTAQDPKAESQELPGRFLETSRDWGPAKLLLTGRAASCLTSLRSRLVFL